MTRITNGIGANTLVVVCIWMQILLMLPHHHHHDAEVPCVNIFHCIGVCSVAAAAQACECGHDHNNESSSQLPIAANHHHDSENNDCALNHLDAIRPERDRISVHFEILPQMLVSQAIYICAVHDNDGVYYNNIIGELDRKRLRVEIHTPTSYISAAIPPRAPSFIV